jgi:hypothetical protein
MSYTCPECGFPKALNIVLSITLPPDSRSDDIIVQTVQCDHCQFRAAAIYEESRRGGFDSESWEHRGYRLIDEDLAMLAKRINRCPDRGNKGCHCKSHEALGKKNDTGRWVLPSGFTRDNSFLMRR